MESHAVWIPTLRQEWILVAVVALLVAASITLQPFFFPEATFHGRPTPLTIFEWLATAFGHAGWISMDRRRRGLPVGPWRYLAILLAPLALWLYFILEYRLLGLALILLSIGVYVFTAVLGAVGASFMPAGPQTFLP